MEPAERNLRRTRAGGRVVKAAENVGKSTSENSLCVCMCKMYALKMSKEDVPLIWGEGRKALVISIGLKAHKSLSPLPPPSSQEVKNCTNNTLQPRVLRRVLMN